MSADCDLFCWRHGRAHLIASRMAVRSLPRREFIAALAALAAWPLAGHAQQPERVRRVGVLMGFAENDPIARCMCAGFCCRRLSVSGGSRGRISGSTTALPRVIQLSSKTYAAELVGLAPDAILAGAPAGGYGVASARRARYRSFSCSWSIPSAWVLFRASRGPAATSPGSAPTTRR